MIIDKIENQGLYTPISKRLEKGFNFINNSNLETIASGTYEIDNKEVFAIVMEYDTEDLKDCVKGILSISTFNI